MKSPSKKESSSVHWSINETPDTYKKKWERMTDRYMCGDDTEEFLKIK